jgi:excisionase family DNA binding protein
VTDKLLLTIAEAVKVSGCSRSFIYERLAEGSIRSVKAGRKRLIPFDSLKAWADSLPTVQPNASGTAQERV